MKEKLADQNIIPSETRILTNIAFMMGDVTDTLLRDAYCRVSMLGCDFKREHKQKWKRAVEATHQAQRLWAQCAEVMYKIDEVDMACEESDWIADTLLLIIDRVGDKKERQDMVRNFLKRMKSYCPIYEKLSHNKL